VRGHPLPQAARALWLSLGGSWDVSLPGGRPQLILVRWSSEAQ